MICRLFPKARIHIVTRGASLADEIVTDVGTVVPRVGMVGGGRRALERVTVFVADSLHHGGGAADILLLDEVHEMVAPRYMGPIGAYTRAKVFGFTASGRGRHDARDPELEAVCGPVLYTMSYQEAQAGGRVVPITVHWLPIRSGPDLTGADPVTRDRLGVWGNVDRNAAIAGYCRGLPPDVQTMVMVKTIDHIVALKALLPEYTMVYAAGGMDRDRLERYRAEGLVGAAEEPMTAARLRELRRRFADGRLVKVIFNYVWATGVNFRGLSVLVRGDASASEIRAVQIPGRVCRRIPGVKESAVLVDCWDAFDQTLLERSRARRRSYLSRGWTEAGARR
jgi:superfamily II DNA or RNA helicase